MTAKTMIYLPGDQLEGLRARARAERIPVTELVRRLVREFLDEPASVRPPAAEVYARIVGLGSSGSQDTGDNHDRYLAEAISRDHLR